jgi:hypothetical protein
LRKSRERSNPAPSRRRAGIRRDGDMPGVYRGAGELAAAVREPGRSYRVRHLR